MYWMLPGVLCSAQSLITCRMVLDAEKKSNRKARTLIYSLSFVSLECLCLLARCSFKDGTRGSAGRRERWCWRINALCGSNPIKISQPLLKMKRPRQRKVRHYFVPKASVSILFISLILPSNLVLRYKNSNLTATLSSWNSHSTEGAFCAEWKSTCLI